MYCTKNEEILNGKLHFLCSSEIVTIKITIHKNKILVVKIYRPPNPSEPNFACNPETIISKLSNKYEKLILMLYFNISTSNPILSHFLDTFALSLLNIDPTCLKNGKNSICKTFCLQISSFVL